MISCAKYLHLNPSLNAQTEFIRAASFVTPPVLQHQTQNYRICAQQSLQIFLDLQGLPGTDKTLLETDEDK